MANELHWSSSRALNTNMEPVYNRLFRAIFTLPEPLRSVYGTEFMTEQLVSIGGVDLDRVPEPVEQTYRGMTRRYPGSLIDTNIDLALTFEVNQDEARRAMPYVIFLAWSNLIYNKADGSQALSADTMGSLIIEKFDKAGVVWKKHTFPRVFLNTNLTEDTNDYTDDSLYQLEVGFAVNNWSTEVVG